MHFSTSPTQQYLIPLNLMKNWKFRWNSMTNLQQTLTAVLNLYTLSHFSFFNNSLSVEQHSRNFQSDEELQ